MLKAMDEFFDPRFKWSRPEGGMFIWAEGPKNLNMDKVYLKAIESNTAFVPGKYFYPHIGDGINTMRLNFTMSSEEQIRTAVQKLAGVVAEFL
ncbi:MAG: 2-aminoadipate transaminase [Deltaproteobacteria bacterium ADurb.Bin510]|nr:MAG: 2-aminoadipate transaminase [Deltaproteobacteria bacterium ADurb.Bin510]